MYPISYTIEDKKVTFKYSKKDWREWNKRGKKYGDVGLAMISIDYGTNFVVYYCYGTIDHPTEGRYTLSLIHNPIYDGGPLLEPNEYLKPQAKKRARERWNNMAKSMKLTFIDFGSNDNLKN